MFLLVAVVLVCGHEWNPKPSPTAVVHCDSHTRFTVLSPRVIRCEYRGDLSSRFEDRASLSFVNRNLPVPDFKVTNTSTWCNISVNANTLVLSYNKESRGECRGQESTDAVCDGKCPRVPKFPDGLRTGTVDSCCTACQDSAECAWWVYAPNTTGVNCWLLTSVVGSTHRSGRVMGGVSNFGGLRAVGKDDSGLSWEWTSGEDPIKSGNLLGTLSPTPSTDLAGCCHNVNNNNDTVSYDPKYPLEPGLLSRAGWALIDDTPQRLLDANEWIVPVSNGRAHASLDWYLFGCGTDYRRCLRDYTKLAGNVTLPPLPAFGVWWSRHWGVPSDGAPFGPMTEAAIMKDVVEGYKEHKLPLNVLVLDMEWHSMLQPPACKEFIGLKGWGGYSWNKTLFPNPAAFVEKLHLNEPHSIRLSLNYHPDNGIDNCQTMYQDMARALGVDPATNALLPDLNQAAENRTYVDAYFKHTIAATRADYAWTDSPKVSTWSNHLYCRAHTADNQRPLVLSRYGGLGNHRSPIGFSGDTLRRWDTLTYEVYMTQRASNVAFTYWSHDIGGFSGAPVDPQHHTESAELFLRWLQFATFAPMFRTHCRYCEQRIWTFPREFFPPMRTTMILRNSLVPYIYTAARATFDSGVGVVHPCYYDYGQDDHAYAPEFDRQYLFGDDFLVAPVTAPLAIDNQTQRTVWIPQGLWIDWVSGDHVVGNQVIRDRSYALAEIPLFVKAGAVVPTRTFSSINATVAEPLVWWIFPSPSPTATGGGQVYEDEGETMDYEHGVFARTNLTYTRTSSAVSVMVHPVRGPTFRGFPSRRVHHVLLWSSSLPALATCGGMALTHTQPQKGPGWWLANNSTVEPIATGSALNGVLYACPSWDVHQPVLLDVHY